MPTGQTIQQILARRAATEGHTVAYRFLLDKEPREYAITYGELDRQARRIAGELRRHCQPGDRAVLFYPPGLEFIAGFFGCLYAGVIAVPAYPPRNNSHSARIESIVRDAEPRVGLTTAATLERLAQVVRDNPRLQAVSLFATDALPSTVDDMPIPTDADNAAVAILQYTSGSTGNPKGVMVTHGNFLHNLAFNQERWELTPESIFVSWLPAFHDMGLVAGILLPLYGGLTGILLSPLSFLQKPVRWLKAISDYRATATIAPNFAYDLCARKIDDDELRQLDLSSWKQVLNGSEPVRHGTLARFLARFRPCGLEELGMIPGYGLAEATLVVTSCSRSQPYRTKKSSHPQVADQHREDRQDSMGGELVGCGYPAADQRVIIVDPETKVRCADGEIGEIWVAGPSVAKGYWRRPDETQETFAAHLADTGEGPFLRTGDLGLLGDNELYVTGRHKDLIIIHGTNYYPPDLEHVVVQCHPALRQEGSAVIAVDKHGEERIVVLQEVERTGGIDYSEVAQRIRENIGAVYGLTVYAVVFVKSHGLPKTSSGKIQRRACKTSWRENSLKILWEWQETDDRDPLGESSETQAQAPSISMSAFRDWLVHQLSTLLRVDGQPLDPDRELSRYGLDSIKSAQLATEVEKYIGRPIPASLVFDYPTINQIVHFVANDPAPISVATPASAHGNDKVAIIGIGCRFPQAHGPDEFWRNLRAGVDAILADFPDARRQEARQPPDNSAASCPRHGGYLSEIDRFDASFFEIAPREAASMDPQQRIVLEVVWEALEHAAIPPERLAGGPTGVFIGVSNFDYSLVELGNSAPVSAYAATGTAHSVVANRVSYYLDLRGPSLVIDTACSSSLVAVHYACASLIGGDCDTAIAGGVNLILRREISASLANANMLSLTGRCRTFDSEADGYVRGEGCGILILKRLADAVRDGNPVIAVIAGSAVNQDGRSNGLTAPNGPAQEAVIRAAMQRAGVTPEQIGYVECHGTGTPLGDPQEIQALRNVLDPDGRRRRPCILGSVKTNIGHLEAAAGVAGLIKAALCLHHNEIPPHLHLRALNPRMRLENSPFMVATSLHPWPADHTRRIAGVSSFGFGGTNAHVILENSKFEIRNSKTPDAHPSSAKSEISNFQSPIANPKAPIHDRPLHVLTLSAKTDQALLALAGRYAVYCEQHPDVSVADLCYTANSGRTHFSRRFAVPTHSLTDAQEKLRDLLALSPPTRTLGDIIRKSPPNLVFLCTGQNARFAAIGKRLYETQPTFRRSIDECSDILRSCASLDLVAILTPPSSPMVDTGDSSGVPDPQNCDDLIPFAVGYALAALWQSWGILPAAAAGVGVGELTAACVAGAIDVTDALKSLARRTQPCDSSRLENGMPQAASDDAGIVEMLRSAKPRIPIMLMTIGDWAPVNGATHWQHRSQEPARWRDGLEKCLRHGYDVFLEIGCDPLRMAEANDSLAGVDGTATDASIMPFRLESGDPWRGLLDTVAQLYRMGYPIDWHGFHRDYSRQIISIPTYPFANQVFWSELPRLTSSCADSCSIQSPTTSAENPSPRRMSDADNGDYVAIIKNVVAEVSRLEASRIDAGEPLQRLGLDSIMAVQLQNEIEARFGIELDAANLANHSIDALAIAIAGQIAAGARVPVHPVRS